MNTHDIAKQIRSFADELEATTPPPKPFTLPTPPPGMKWHREDGWTAEMLPAGTRPLCFGERVEDKGCESYSEHAWVEQRIQGSLNISNAHRNSFLRTTRPLLFQRSGHEWTWHRAGDPMPCDGDARILIVGMGGETIACDGFPLVERSAHSNRWDQTLGWRYADAEQPDPYAELKKAHAEGKVIQFRFRDTEPFRDIGPVEECGGPSWKYPVKQYRIKPDEIPWTEWHGGECPLKDEDEEVEEWECKFRKSGSEQVEPFHRSNTEPSMMEWGHRGHLGDIIAYRVLKTREPKPKVPLGKDDVPPGSVFRTTNEVSRTHWIACVFVMDRSIELLQTGSTFNVPFEELQKSWQINRSIPLTGKWDATKWEACEK